jgi:Tfp pilus assembly protein PilX
MHPRKFRASGLAPSKAGQQGIALIVGLVMLVILALLGTTAYSVATQEERMAGNARDHARAFQAAEFALRECEKAVQLGPDFLAPAAAPANYGMLSAPTNGQWTGDLPLTDWQQYAAVPAGYKGEAARLPLCIAEDFEKGAKLDPSTAKKLIPHTARVTALGFGMNNSSKVTLVSYVSYFTTH